MVAKKTIYDHTYAYEHYIPGTETDLNHSFLPRIPLNTAQSVREMGTFNVINK